MLIHQVPLPQIQHQPFSQLIRFQISTNQLDLQWREREVMTHPKPDGTVDAENLAKRQPDRSENMAVMEGACCYKDWREVVRHA